MAYKITSVKHSEQFDGDIAEAIARAKGIESEYQPAYGVQVSHAGETVFDTEESYIDSDGCCIECGHPADGSSGCGHCESPAHS